MFTENVFTLLQTEGTFRKVQLMELQRYASKGVLEKKKKNKTHMTFFEGSIWSSTSLHAQISSVSLHFSVSTS